MSEDNQSVSWWKTMPGILTGLAATITALTALLGALSQTGLFTADKANEATPASTQTTQPSVPPTPSPKSVARPTSALELPTTGSGLLEALSRVNVGNSVGDAMMLQWLNSSDRRYSRLAEACLYLLGGRSLAADGADLDKINYLYLRALGLPDGAEMPLDHDVNTTVLEKALIESYNDKNGTRARSLAEIVT